MVREIRVGDFFIEKEMKSRQTGVILEVKRDPEGDGVVRVLLSGGRMEGWSYRNFLNFHEVYR